MVMIDQKFTPNTYLAGVIPENEHSISGGVHNHTQLPVARVDIVLERVTGFARQNVLGGDVLSKPIENVDLLSVWRVDFVLAR